MAHPKVTPWLASATVSSQVEELTLERETTALMLAQSTFSLIGYVRYLHCVRVYVCAFVCVDVGLCSRVGDVWSDMRAYATLPETHTSR